MTSFPIPGNTNRGKKWLDDYLDKYDILKQINNVSSDSI